MESHYNSNGHDQLAEPANRPEDQVNVQDEGEQGNQDIEQDGPVSRVFVSSSSCPSYRPPEVRMRNSDYFVWIINGKIKRC